MDIEIQVLERETIKPSSPTPSHLRSLKLSLLDQFGPVYLTPLLFFYPGSSSYRIPFQNLNSIASERSQILKKSLSQTLNHFYPFAGRIGKDNFSIDCNDEGVEYVDARVNCLLSKVLANPEPQTLKKLIPPETVAREAVFTTPLLLVQASFFECGGMAIGACFSHKIADGYTTTRLLKCWAAETSLDSSAALAFVPQFVSATLFPPHESFASKFQGFEAPNDVKIAIRRMVFRRPRIEALISKLASSTVGNPTRVEAVLALIWKCAMEASASVSGSQRPSMMFPAVDLRKRFVPHLPENYAGNLAWVYGAKSGGVDEFELENLVVALRKGLEDFKENFGTRIGPEEISNFMEVFRKHKKNGEVYTTSSMCRFPFYEVNFGWGKPSWVCFPNISVKNRIIMMDTIDGDGIEVGLALSEEEMGFFERNDELLTFASFKICQ